jgi:MYXO-CTERM domain-containing protein
MTLHRTLCCALVLLAGCADRQGDIDDDDAEVLPVCLVIPARGFWEDGRSKVIVDETGYSPAVCMCMTEQERYDHVWDEELNERAYVECKRVEGLYWDFDWTDCQESYETGEWLIQVRGVADEFALLNRIGFDCDGGLEDESCSVTNTNDGDPSLALVFVALLGLRRRRRGARE